jgi:hypothetical protein
LRQEKKAQKDQDAQKEEIKKVPAALEKARLEVA